MFGVLPTSVRLRHPPGDTPCQRKQGGRPEYALFQKSQANSAESASFDLKNQTFIPKITLYAIFPPHRRCNCRSPQLLPAALTTSCRPHTASCTGDAVPPHPPGAAELLHPAETTRKTIISMPRQTSLLLLALAALTLSACQQHPASRNVPVLEVHH